MREQVTLKKITAEILFDWVTMETGDAYAGVVRSIQIDGREILGPGDHADSDQAREFPLSEGADWSLALRVAGMGVRPARSTA